MGYQLSSSEVFPMALDVLQTSILNGAFLTPVTAQLDRGVSNFC